MRNMSVQMSIEDIYNGVSESMESQKSELVSLLEEHINLDELIPYSFRVAFYGRMGRNHIYHLESFLWFIILKKLFGLSENTQLINILKCSSELRKAAARIAPFVSNGFVPNPFRFPKRVLAFVLAIHLVPIPPMENVFTPIPTRIFAFIRAFREIRSSGIISTSTVSLWREPLTC